MKSLVVVSGPRDAGPGERQEMLDRARQVFEQLDTTPTVRIDVPGRGTAEAEEEHGTLRHAVEPIVPALQSGSLFGERTGVLVVDAHHLLKGEAEAIAELIEHVNPETVTAVFLAAGSLPQPLGKVLAAQGESIQVKKLRERDASEWLAQAARGRRLKLHGDAAALLLQRFGSDVAALGQALDQLAASGEGEVSAEEIQTRFRNRPDEPMWHYSDAVADGDVGTALRRLSDFLVHGHPLQLLAFVENDLRRRSLAAAAPNLGTLAEWIGAGAETFPVQKAWRRRHDTREQDLARALDAVSRADLLLKTAPEATHRLTLERLTVALCRWYGGGRKVS